MQSKRAVSSLVVIALLILMIFVVIASIFMILKNLKLNESKAKVSCLNDVDVTIINACYKSNILEITVKNNKEPWLGDFLLLSFDYEDGTNEQKPTPPGTIIKSFESKTIIMPYVKSIKKLYVIPRIQESDNLCLDNAPSFENVIECTI